MVKPNKEKDTDLKPDRLKGQLGHLLRRVHQKASTNMQERVRPLNLTIMQCAVLYALNEHGKLSQNKLGRIVSIESGNIGNVVKRLIYNGLVKAEKDPVDKRRIQLILTTKGQYIISEVMVLSDDSSEATMKDLTIEERNILHGLLERML
ncbi:MAG: MarR family transcriptional regulator [Emcibacteraceae bacterium]|nr:MarR family transcriptional regulator [Emcibacteraceae bacterium]MDG1997089.1 MarR family transcriptional regulator [Emcibacteraceae bacterium]